MISLYKTMIKLCCGKNVDARPTRFKLQQLADLNSEELNEQFVQINNDDLLNKFNINLKTVFEVHLNDNRANEKSLEEYFALEYMFHLEFIQYSTNDGHINLSSDKNRYQLVKMALNDLNKKFTLSEQQVRFQ